MANRTTCLGCGPNSQGYLVQLPTAQHHHTLQTFLMTLKSSAWHTSEDCQLWIEDKLFYEYFAYWNEFADIKNWKICKASHHPDGTLHIAEALDWHQLERNRPSMWIDDVIQNGRLRMMYQPIVSLDENDVIGYEMLARAFREDDSMVAPVELFSAAKEQSQLFQLDRACRIRAIAAGKDLAKDKMVFVNFIPTSIYVPEHCLQTTLAAVSQNGLHSSQVVFEVVETEQVGDLSHLKRILQFYRAQGFRYALDDVGEGFNDFEMLKSLEPDIVKLDRKWVTNIHEDAEKRQVALHVLGLTQEVGAIALAEGIETQDEARTLAAMGYRWQQGFYYGRPDWQPNCAGNYDKTSTG